MPRGPARKPPICGARFTVAVCQSYASVGHRYCGQKDGVNFSSITFEGSVSPHVIRRKSALIYVHCDCSIGGAIGVNTTHWQVVVTLPPTQFNGLMLLFAQERILTIELLTDALRYGRGRVRSVCFCTHSAENYLDALT
jgi:hypothetical protein